MQTLSTMFSTDSMNICVISLTETWLTADQSQDYKIDGYSQSIQLGHTDQLLANHKEGAWACISTRQQIISTPLSLSSSFFLFAIFHQMKNVIDIHNCGEYVSKVKCSEYNICHCRSCI